MRQIPGQWQVVNKLFRAFDADSGKELWSYKLPAGGYAVPSVYEVDGKQYVVIAAGGGNRMGTPSGDAFIAFSLADGKK
jgi:quinoprotein glucose dehydrogenase